MRGVGLSDASKDGLAWAIHTEKQMRLVVRKTEKEESIFHTEFEAMYRGQLDIIHDLPPWSAYAWLGDNVGAIYVSRKGLSKFREVNKKLLELFTLKQEAKLRAHHSYICSEENPMDRASRLAREYIAVAPPCTEHPGDMCNEFLAWIQQHSQNPTESEK